MWKAAAIQRAVGVGFAGDATLVPVDLLVESLWLNADQPVRRGSQLEDRIVAAAAAVTEPVIGTELGPLACAADGPSRQQQRFVSVRFASLPPAPVSAAFVGSFLFLCASLLILARVKE